MCKIKNKEMEAVLSFCREIDKEGIEDFSDDKIAETTIDVTAMIEELSTYKKKMEKELIKRDYKTVVYSPKWNKKLFLKEGNATKNYNVPAIYEESIKQGILSEFFDWVKYIDSKASDSIKDIAMSNYNKIPSNKTIVSIVKMSKEELKEKDMLTFSRKG